MELIPACSLAAGTTFFLPCLIMLHEKSKNAKKKKQPKNCCNKRAFLCKRNGCCVFPSITYMINLKQDSILFSLFWNSILSALFSFLTLHHPAAGKKQSQHGTTSGAKATSLLKNKTVLKRCSNLKKWLTYKHFTKAGNCCEGRLRNQAQIRWPAKLGYRLHETWSNCLLYSIFQFLLDMIHAVSLW